MSSTFERLQSILRAQVAYLDHLKQEKSKGRVAIGAGRPLAELILKAEADVVETQMMIDSFKV